MFARMRRETAEIGDFTELEILSVYNKARETLPIIVSKTCKKMPLNGATTVIV